VKARNPHLSVCQLGATIGRMWRELTEDEKRQHLEDFHQDKVTEHRETARPLTHSLRYWHLTTIHQLQDVKWTLIVQRSRSFTLNY